MTTAFYGNRLASLSDLRTPEWESSFNELEAESGRFVGYMLKNDLYPVDYRWPVDSLHNYTRIWEYPYVFAQLRKHRAAVSGVVRVLDVGPGLSFMPATLSNAGYSVTAVDYDGYVAEVMGKVQERTDCPDALRRVTYLQGDCQSLDGIGDASQDVVLATSVLEHVPFPERALHAIHRALRPAGLCISTFDLQWDPVMPAGFDRPFTVDGLQSFLQTADSLFQRPEDDVFVHPRDVLRYSNHPREVSGRALVHHRSLVQRLMPLSTVPRRVAYLMRRRLFGADVFCVYGLTLVKR